MSSEATTARYQRVLAWRGEGLSYGTMGARLGISATRARDLHRAALNWHRRMAPPPPPRCQRLTPDQPVDALPIPARAKESLHRHGLHTVGEVVEVHNTALLAMRDIGPLTVATIRAELGPEVQQGASSAVASHQCCWNVQG